MNVGGWIVSEELVSRKGWIDAKNSLAWLHPRDGLEVAGGAGPSWRTRQFFFRDQLSAWFQPILAQLLGGCWVIVGDSKVQQ